MPKVSKEPSEVPTAPKPQFKKLKKKNKARLRARDDEDDEHDDGSAMEAIQQTKKKRKLLNEVLYKKGLDAAATMKASSEVTVVETAKTETDGDTTDRLRTFAGGGGDATAEGGVLQRKHASAMEEFIHENLKQEAAEKETSTPKNSATDELFAELASTSQKLAGTTSVAAAVDEGDVGAGGAMLGGTGIAEVKLPADDRIQTIRETQEAVTSFATAGNERSSAVPQDALDNTPSGTNDVSNVPASYSHNFQLHTQEWVQQKKQEDEKVAPAIQHEEEDSHDGRMGFEAARRAARGDGATNSADTGQGKKRSNDDRAWKNFMTRQQKNRDRF